MAQIENEPEQIGPYELSPVLKDLRVEIDDAIAGLPADDENMSSEDRAARRVLIESTEDIFKMMASADQQVQRRIAGAQARIRQIANESINLSKNLADLISFDN